MTHTHFYLCQKNCHVTKICDSKVSGQGYTLDSPSIPFTGPTAQQIQSESDSKGLWELSELVKMQDVHRIHTHSGFPEKKCMSPRLHTKGLNSTTPQVKVRLANIRSSLTHSLNFQRHSDVSYSRMIFSSYLFICELERACP